MEYITGKPTRGFREHAPGVLRLRSQFNRLTTYKTPPGRAPLAERLGQWSVAGCLLQESKESKVVRGKGFAGEGVPGYHSDLPANSRAGEPAGDRPQRTPQKPRKHQPRFATAVLLLGYENFTFYVFLYMAHWLAPDTLPVKCHGRARESRPKQVPRFHRESATSPILPPLPRL